MATIVFVIPDQCTLLDLAGPVQVFEEARAQGAPVELAYVQYQAQACSSAGLAFAAVPHFSTAALQAGDLVVIPGLADGALPSAADDKYPEFYS